MQKRTVAAALLAMCLSGPAYAGDWMKAADFPWPSSSEPVILKNYHVRVGWVDGIPMGERQDCAPLLHLPTEGPSIDLRQVLVEKGYLIRENGGTVEIKAGSPGASTSTLAPQASVPLSAAPVRVTDEQLRAVQNLAAVLVSEKKTIVKSDARQPRVDKIGEQVAVQARRPIMWIFLIVQDRSPNAFCCGEGIVAVTTGLLDLELTDDELAGVLSHEVAHGARQHLERGHVARAASNSAIQRSGFDVAYNRYKNDQAEAQRQAEISQQQDYASGTTGSNAANQAMAEDRAKESQQMAAARAREALEERARYASVYGNSNSNQIQLENEADMQGIKYAYAAGFKMDGLATALEKVQGSHPTQFGVAPKGGETHPPIAERIVRVRRLVNSLTAHGGV